MALSLPGFYTPVGVFTIAGLHVFPGYLYFLGHLPAEWAALPRVLLYTPAVVLGTGRALCFGVEVRRRRRRGGRREEKSMRWCEVGILVTCEVGMGW